MPEWLSRVVKFRDAYGDNMQSFNFQSVNHDCVARKVNMINIREATGYDNIPTKLLRLAKNELTHLTDNLMNSIMAITTFIKEDNLNKMNFRPMSILTGVSKLYDTVVNWSTFGIFLSII